MKKRWSKRLIGAVLTAAILCTEVIPLGAQTMAAQRGEVQTAMMQTADQEMEPSVVDPEPVVFEPIQTEDQQNEETVLQMEDAEEEGATGYTGYPADSSLEITPYVAGKAYKYHVDAAVYMAKSPAGEEIVIDSYTMYSYDTASGKYVEIASTKGTRMNVSLKSGQKFYISAKGHDSAGNTYIHNRTGSMVKMYLPQGYLSTALSSNGQVQLHMEYFRRNEDYGTVDEYTVQKIPVTGYEIYRSTKSDSGYKKIANCDNAYYVDKSAVQGKKYFYKVRPYAYSSVSGTYSYGYMAEAKKIVRGIGAVEEITAARVNDTSIKLSWTKATGADYYEIYYAKIIAGDTEFKYLTKTSNLYYTFKELQQNSNYRFYVRAVNEVGKKKYYEESEEIDSSTGMIGPGNIKITSQSLTVKNGVMTQKLTFKWDKVKGASKYYVCGINYQNKYHPDRIASTKQNTYQLTQKLALSDSVWNYFYGIRIIALVGGNEYDYTSDLVTGVRPALMAPEVKLSSKTSDSVKLSWTKVNGADQYDIYRIDGIEQKAVRLGTVHGKYSFQDKELKQGVTYQYKVVASNQEMVRNGILFLEPKESEAVFYVPKVQSAIVKAVNKKGKKVVLTIKDSSKLAVQYEIYRADSKKGNYKKIKTVKAKAGGTVNYTDVKRTKGKIYYYKVVSVIRSKTGVTVRSERTAARSVNITR